MVCRHIRFSGHALMRMFERGLSTEDVSNTLQTGEIITHYPDDRPYPSSLVLGWRDRTPIHVVVAQAPEPDAACVIVTVYIPSEQLWNDGFRRRRNR